MTSFLQRFALRTRNVISVPRLLVNLHTTPTTIHPAQTTTEHNRPVKPTTTNATTNATTNVTTNVTTNATNATTNTTPTTTRHKNYKNYKNYKSYKSYKSPNNNSEKSQALTEKQNNKIAQYNTRLEELCQAMNWGKFDVLVHEMKVQCLPFTESTLQLILTAYDKQRRGSDAVSMWKQALDAGVVPGAECCTLFALALIREDKYSEMEQVVQEMEAKQMPLDIEFYNRVLSVCSWKADWSLWKRWFQKLKESKLQPNVKTDVVRLNAYRRMGREKHFVETWKEIEQKGNVPNNAYFVYASWLYAKGKEAEFDRLLDRMKKEGHVISTRFWNTIISHIVQTESWHQVDLLTRKLRQQNEATRDTYSMLFESYQKQGRWYDSLIAYKEARERNILLREDNYTSVILAAINTGDLKYALIVYDEMCEVMKPSIGAFNKWFNACIETKQWRGAAEFNLRRTKERLLANWETKRLRRKLLQEYEEWKDEQGFDELVQKSIEESEKK